MSFNKIIKEAAENGGKASETLPAPHARQEIDTPTRNVSPTLSTDSRLITREGRSYSNRVDKLRDSRKNDLLQKMEDANHAIDVAKKFKKNIEIERRARQMEQVQHDLAQYWIKPLALRVVRSRTLRFLPPSLVAVADNLSRLTGLDALGIVYALLGGISIATWGRITIKLHDRWPEPAVDMLLQVSPSGTRKSALVRELRKPFEQYCAKANEGYKERMQQARTEQHLLSINSQGSGGNPVNILFNFREIPLHHSHEKRECWNFSHTARQAEAQHALYKSVTFF